MKILTIKYKNIGVFRDGVILDFTAKDRVSDMSQVTQLYETIYTQRVIGITGPNASGKTTLLKLLQLALKIVVRNYGLNDLELSEGILLENTEMTVDFYSKGVFYRLVSTIGIKNVGLHKEYYFKEEVVYKKFKSEIKNKNSINAFNTIELRRSEMDSALKKFLKPHDSIVSQYVEEGPVLMDTLINTNANLYNASTKSVMSFINLFDSSIEDIKSDEESNDLMIKFKNDRDGYIKSTYLDAENYLSSGTIKGSTILNKIAFVMKNGGYLIIDEIENHLHKKLVQLLINIFNDDDINVSGATMIFTTHYSEIFDSVDRKDNIYVLIRDEKFTSIALRYSDIINRNDIKKSDILLSNYIDGTSPKYEDITRVKELLCKLVKS